MNSLTTPEQNQLQDLELVIERGLKTFFEVGNALTIIRSQRLYRASHDTFEEYCNQRWQMSRSYASRMIGAAEVVNNLLPIGNEGDPLPANESQARPLTHLEPKQQQQAWQTAVKATEGKVTATAVKQAVEEITNPEELAYQWLKAYRDGHRNWTDLTANQTYHGSSPCWQRFERELPHIAQGSKGKLHLKIARERLIYERNLTITPEQVEGLVTRAVNDWLHENATIVEIADLLQRWITPDHNRYGRYIPSLNKLEERTEGISPDKIRAALEACYQRVAHVHNESSITQMPGENTARYLERTLDDIEETIPKIKPQTQQPQPPSEDIADVMFQHLTGTKTAPKPAPAPDVNVHDPIQFWMITKHLNDLRGQFTLMSELLEHQEDSTLWPELIEQLPSGWKKRQVVNTLKLFYNLTRRLLFAIEVAEARTKLLAIVTQLDGQTERETLFLINGAVMKLFDAEKQLRNSFLAEETIPHTWKP